MSRVERNRQRGTRALGALAHYKAVEMREDGPICQDTVTDFLTDLRHYCARNDLDIEACLRMSQEHHQAEVTSIGD